MTLCQGNLSHYFQTGLANGMVTTKLSQMSISRLSTFSPRPPQECQTFGRFGIKSSQGWLADRSFPLQAISLST